MAYDAIVNQLCCKVIYGINSNLFSYFKKKLPKLQIKDIHYWIILQRLMQFIFGAVIIWSVFLVLILLLCFFSQYVVYVDKNNAF